MAEFDFSMDMDKIFPKGIQDESLALDMIEAGQNIMQKAIQRNALKHRKTNSMSNSIKCSKPTVNKNGDAVGRVKFYGKDENGTMDWYKAIWLEYGTVNQPAKPFVRPAIKSSEGAIRAAMQKKFDQKVGNK